MRSDAETYRPDGKPGFDPDHGYERFPYLRVGFFCLVLMLSAFVGVSFFLPRSYSAQGDVFIEAPAVAVYSLINNFKHWEHWSPLHQRYPEMEMSYPISRSFGTGAILKWQSGGETKGQVELLQSYPFRRIEALMTTEGYEGLPAHVRFELARETGGTRVTYTFSGMVHDDPINRWFALLVEPAARAEYRKAMDALKTVAETQKQGERSLSSMP